MTEEEKSYFLAVVKERFCLIEVQLTKELRALHDKILTAIAKTGPVPLGSAMMAIRLGLVGVGQRNTKKLNDLRDVISFIEQTEASLLTPEAIRKKIKLAKMDLIYASKAGQVGDYLCAGLSRPN